jgi:hypothetical protein
MPNPDVVSHIHVPVAPIGGNIEDGLPGTPKKIGATAIFLVSTVACAVTIAYVSTTVGLLVLGGGLLVSATLGVWGMVENYQENKKKHQLQMENLEKQNAFLNARTNQTNLQMQQQTPMPAAPTPLNNSNIQTPVGGQHNINSLQPATNLSTSSNQSAGVVVNK